MVYYRLSFWLYLNGLRRASASEAGLFINLVPVLALAGAFGLLALAGAEPVAKLHVGLAGSGKAKCQNKAAPFSGRPLASIGRLVTDIRVGNRLEEGCGSQRGRAQGWKGAAPMTAPSSGPSQ